MTETNFEKASRLKLRFTVGTLVNLTTEDLWSLPLTGNNGNNLDALAVDLYNQKTASAPKSFVGVAQETDVNKTLELKFDIVKTIIDRKQEDIAEKEANEARKSQIRLLQDLKARKQIDELESLSMEEIEAKLAALKD